MLKEDEETEEAEEEPGKDLQQDTLLKMLFEQIKQENTIRSTARSTMNFYSTLLLSLTGGILIISKDLKPELFSICFIVGGLCLVVISVMAGFHYKSDYRRQIESMAIQAKIEDVLGFTQVGKNKTSYWIHEAIIPSLYVQTRKKYKNSSDFVDSFVKGTDMTYIRIYYSVFIFIGICYLIYGTVSML